MKFITEMIRLSGKRFVWKVWLVVLASIGISFLDAAALASVIPLVQSLGDSRHSTDVPLLGVLSATQLLGIIVFLFVSKSICSAAIRWWATGVVASATSLTASRLVRLYLRAPIEFHDTRNSANVISSTSRSVDMVFFYGFLAFVTAMVEGATIVVLALLVVVVSPVAAASGVVFVAITSLVFIRVIQKQTRIHAKRADVMYVQTLKILQEGLLGAPEHRLRGTLDVVSSAFSEQRLQYDKSRRITSFASELSRYYLEATFIGAFGVIAVVLLWQSAGDKVLSTLGLILALGFRILPSVSRILGSLAGFKIGRVALNQIIRDLDDLGVRVLADTRDGEYEIEGIRLYEIDEPAGVILDAVSYRYSGVDTWALSNVNLDLPPGASLGVIGASGSGKSTLVDLLCGFRNPQRGQVKLWKQANQIDSGGIRVGLVPQDVFMVDGTILENVTLGLPVDVERASRLLERVGLGDFMTTLPDGLQTTVGERGSRLSGGQRQRIAIARALYGGPSVLILDEATSAMDSETESVVAEAIDNLRGAVTVIVVAHKMSMIRKCDVVLHLNEGAAVAFGKPSEVLVN